MTRPVQQANSARDWEALIRRVERLERKRPPVVTANDSDREDRRIRASDLSIPNQASGATFTFDFAVVENTGPFRIDASSNIEVLETGIYTTDIWVHINRTSNGQIQKANLSASFTGGSPAIFASGGWGALGNSDTAPMELRSSVTTRISSPDSLQVQAICTTVGATTWTGNCQVYMTQLFPLITE